MDKKKHTYIYVYMHVAKKAGNVSSLLDYVYILRSSYHLTSV